jgi:arsenite-transporting ATPase
LELPVDWSKHIEEAAQGGGHTCIGPVQAIQESKVKYDKATALIKDQTRTSFVFVMRPEELSLYETRRAAGELATIGVQPGEIIINGILPEEVCTIDFFATKRQSQQRVIEAAEAGFTVPKRYMYLRDTEIKGLAGISTIARELFEGVVEQVPAASVTPVQEISLIKPDMNALLTGNETKHIFFTGKGGVGKTTISCITAYYLAQQGKRTLLVTTDPAGHIGEVLGQKVASQPTRITDTLSAVMIDQQQAFIEYKARILSEAEGRFSADMLAAMEEELNSPCTQEMAAFEQFTKYIRTTEYDAVVFDTAPTGHTLRLLSLPFDYAKQVEMMVSVSAESIAAKASSQQKYGEVIDTLRDPAKSLFALLLYPESTPIVEAYRAKQDLAEAGIETRLVVANLVLPEAVCTNAFFANRRKMQLGYLQDIEAKFKAPVLQYPMLESEIRGLSMLQEAAGFLSP